MFHSLGRWVARHPWLICCAWVLVGVISTGGVREFVLYTGDGQWLEEFQGAISAAVGTHEIQMMARRDPEWRVYRAFVKT